MPSCWLVRLTDGGVQNWSGSRKKVGSAKSVRAQTREEFDGTSCRACADGEGDRGGDVNGDGDRDRWWARGKMLQISD